jgi:hypothetical protein
MGTIKAITDDGHDQHHHCEVPKCSRDERPSNAMRITVVISLGATRRPCRQMQQRHCDDVVSITVILIPQLQSLSKERQLPRRTRDKHNQQPGGPLNGKPQVDWAYSCLRSPATRTSRATTKHVMKNLQKNNKKYSHVTLHHATRVQQQRTQSTDAVPSDNKTSTHCNNNNKDKNYDLHFHFDKADSVVVVPFTSLTIDSQVKKRAIRKRCFLHFWTTISNFTDTVLMGLDSIDADLNRPDDVMNPFDFDK